MDIKKHYAPPHMIPYPAGQVPESIERLFLNDVITFGETKHVAPACTTVIDSDRKYVQVSNSFCELLGYKSEELIGRRCDEITAPRTSDIPTMFSLFKKLGYMQGLWMLVHRTGERILIRYESWLRPDSFIETNIEVVDHLR
jgi:PAS domain S-box-containing protein